MSHSKRYKEAIKLVDKDKVYSLEEGIDILKNMPHTKFDETLEVSCKMGVDPKQADQMVRGSLLLPHGTGKTVKLLVICEPEKEGEAKEAGADYVGGQDLVDKILKEGWLDFDYCISTPSMMKFMGKLGKILGPRGLMPSPKAGTVTDKISAAIKEAKRGKINFRMDKFGCLHIGVGKISFSKEALIENTRSCVETIIANKPSAVKGEFINVFYLSATMSPSIKVKLG